MFKTPELSTKNKEKSLINSFVGSHDLVCYCNNPALHCLQILIKQLKPELKQEEINQLKQCLGDDHTTTETAEDTGYDIGDLEKMFGEDDAGEEDDTR